MAGNNGLVPALVMGEVRAQRIEMEQLSAVVHRLDRKVTHLQCALESQSGLVGRIAQIVLGGEYGSDGGEPAESGALSEGELRRRDWAVRAELTQYLPWVKASCLPARPEHAAVAAPEQVECPLDLGDAVPPPASGVRADAEAVTDAVGEGAEGSSQEESPGATAERSPSPAAVSLTACWGWASAMPSAGSSAPQCSSPPQPARVTAWTDVPREQDVELPAPGSLPGSSASSTAGGTPPLCAWSVEMLDGAAAVTAQRPAPPGTTPPDTPRRNISAASRAERPAGSGRRRSRPLGAGAEAAPRGAEPSCSPAVDTSCGPIFSAAVEEAEIAAPQEPSSARPSGEVRADDEDGDDRGTPRSPPSPPPLWEEADGSSAPPFLPAVEWAAHVTPAGAGVVHDDEKRSRCGGQCRARLPEQQQQQQGHRQCDPMEPPPPPPEDAVPIRGTAPPGGGGEGAARRGEGPPSIYEHEEQSVAPPPPPEKTPSRRACSPPPPQGGAALGPRRKARQTGPTPQPPQRATSPAQRAQEQPGIRRALVAL